MPDIYKILIKIDTNGGKQNCIFINFNGIKYLICNARKRNDNMLNLARIFNIEILQVGKNNIEYETIKQIKKVFKIEEMIEQYNYEKYRIDLYLPKYKIAIECDELHHKNKN